MTIYVDDPMPIGGKFDGWCHCWHDTGTAHPELLTFGDNLAGKGKRLPVHRSRGPSGEFSHYDLSPAMRARALKQGAKYIPLKHWIRQRPGWQAFIRRTGGKP